jgi:GNAT superfamily N-acetyltransferase
MNLSFRKPIADELDVIYSIYEAAIKHMESNNIFQWDKIYPDKTVLAEDMQKSELIIGVLGEEIAVAFVLNQECDEQYQNGNWKYPDASYCVVHRLCVNPKFQKMGIGTRTMLYIADEVKRKGIESVRLDCFTLNHMRFGCMKN